MTRLVTLFGGGGFVGRYVAQALLKQGARVRIVAREPRRAWFIRPQGGLGQTQFVAADVTKPDSVARAVTGSDAVVNLVAVMAGRLDAINVAGAANVARAAASAGAAAFVHVSAIGADPASSAAYGRSKGEAERAVREAFPAATIVRPSIVFGPEDDFLNRFARMIQWLPVVPVIAPRTRFQPVFVADVARAIADAVLDPEAHAGRTSELGGPEIVTMRALNERIATLIGRAPTFVDVPDAMAAGLARLGALPGAPLTMDQWKMLSRDNVVTDDSNGLAAFGIDATPIAAAAPAWLVRFHRQGRFGAERRAA